MTVIVVEDPPQPLKQPKSIIMQIILIHSIVSLKLFLIHGDESLVREKIVHRIGNLLDIEVDITFIIFVSSWM